MASRQKPIPLPTANWPTADVAQAARLFTPLPLGPIQAAERTWVPAMVPWRATEDGTVTEENLDWYGRFAKGQPGVLVAEATGIRDIRSGPLLRISHDRYLPGLRNLVDRVRAESAGRTRFLIQLIDFLAVRRRPEPAVYFARYLQLEDRHREALATYTDDTAWQSAEDDAVRAGLAAQDDACWQAVLGDWGGGSNDNRDEGGA